VDTIIVGPSSKRASEISLLTRVFDRPPTVARDVVLWTLP
jgi:hypothetical protein